MHLLLLLAVAIALTTVVHCETLGAFNKRYVEYGTGKANSRALRFGKRAAYDNSRALRFGKRSMAQGRALRFGKRTVDASNERDVDLVREWESGIYN